MPKLQFEQLRIRTSFDPRVAGQWVFQGALPPAARARRGVALDRAEGNSGGVSGQKPSDQC